MGQLSTRLVPMRWDFRASVSDPTPEILCGFVRWTCYPPPDQLHAPRRVTFDVRRDADGKHVVEWMVFLQTPAGHIVMDVSIDNDRVDVKAR